MKHHFATLTKFLQLPQAVQDIPFALVRCGSGTINGTHTTLSKWEHSNNSGKRTTSNKGTERKEKEQKEKKRKGSKI